jgi:hypothetical protein
MSAQPDPGVVVVAGAPAGLVVGALALLVVTVEPLAELEPQPARKSRAELKKGRSGP